MVTQDCAPGKGFGLDPVPDFFARADTGLGFFYRRALEL
jgi:hypothetical protein